jgi:hypothetical protein
VPRFFWFNRSRLGEGGADLVPDNLVGFIAADRIQERGDPFKIEVVRISCRIKSRKIPREAFVTTSRRQQTRHREALQR